MKMGEAEAWLHAQLQSIYDARESSNIAAWVFEKLTGQNRLQRLTDKNAFLSAQQLQDLNTIAQRLSTHEPVQYVLSEAYFAGLRLYVDASVLIPRPETEELVEWITKDVQAYTRTGRDTKILDVGTGSGCIALALKKALPDAEVWAIEKSSDALITAQRNSAETGHHIDFHQMDVLDKNSWKQLPQFDIITSNPPYIPQKDAAAMQPNVVAHEPHLALFVPDDNPMLFYDALALLAIEKLKMQGRIYVEIEENSANEVSQVFANAGLHHATIKKDMQGKNRMIKATLL